MRSGMWKATMSVMAMLATLATARAERDVDFVVVAMPATVLIDMNGDKFSVESTDENGTSTTSLSEVYTMPNILLGVGIPVGNARVDVGGGGGVLINDNFRSFMLQAVADVTWQVSDSLDIGPRIGLMYLPNPEWLDSDDVEFESDMGFLVGVQLAMGDKIQYIVSVDLIDFSLGVDESENANVTTSEEEFNMSALAIQFGVRGEF